MIRTLSLTVTVAALAGALAAVAVFFGLHVAGISGNARSMA
jgi:hypothetical protein